MTPAASTVAPAVAPWAPPARARRYAPRRRMGWAGIAVMVVFHLALGGLLVSGLGRHVVQVIQKPIDATIVQEVLLPPPPPPPPPPREVVQQAPSPATPPPAWVPPAEVAAPATDAPAITAVQTPVPPADPPPVTPPAPPAPMVAAAPPAPARRDIAVACPKQAAPAIPEKALDEGISGTVRAEVRIRGGRVADVQIVSGPRVFHAAVRAALAQYQCLSQPGEEILATQDFEFKVE